MNHVAPDFPSSIDEIEAFFWTHWPAECEKFLAKGLFVTNPYSLAVTNRTRHLLLERGLIVPADACTIYLYGNWDGANALGTRLGGQPARDWSIPWPTNHQGEQIPFFAQLDFSEAPAEISHRAAGRHLSIYSTNLSGYTDMDLRFQWVDPDNARLPTSDECAPTVAARGFQGVPLPSVDYKMVHASCDCEDDCDERSILGSNCAASLIGTKLGGIDPCRAKHFAYVNWEKNPQEWRSDLGMFLGLIGCVQPWADLPWPYTNQREPMTWRQKRAQPGCELIFGDMGSISLYLQPDDTVEWYPNIQ